MQKKNNKRLKIAPFIMEALSDKCIEIMRGLNIASVEIIMRSAMRIHLRIFIFKLTKLTSMLLEF